MPQEAKAQFGDPGRGVDMRSSDDAHSDASIDGAALHPEAADPATFNTVSSPRHVRFPPGYASDDNSGSSSAIQSLTSASTLSTLESKLDLSPTEVSARRGVLRDSFLDGWKDDAAAPELDNPEEMQKNDPLGTQIWKLYHKTRGQLPNSERLENLSWRMMSMNLRRKELQRQGWATRWCSHTQDGFADTACLGFCRLPKV